MSGRSSKDFDVLEDQLAAALKPVPPKQDFVRTVRQRMSVAAPVIAIRPTPDVGGWMVALAEVVAIFVLVAVFARLLFRLVERQR
jgi:hypothetical protein